MFLFECYQSKQNRDYEFHAALQGIDLNKGKPKKRKDIQSADPAVPLFGDPEDYLELSEEQKENLTNKMLGKHKSWAENSLNKKV